MLPATAKAPTPRVTEPGARGSVPISATMRLRRNISRGLNADSPPDDRWTLPRRCLPTPCGPAQIAIAGRRTAQTLFELIFQQHGAMVLLQKIRERFVGELLNGHHAVF